ncbi:MAG: hypothetical protein ACLFQ0_03585 [Cyclobacteriaceae bacterium]
MKYAVKAKLNFSRLCLLLLVSLVQVSGRQAASPDSEASFFLSPVEESEEGDTISPLAQPEFVLLDLQNRLRSTPSLALYLPQDLRLLELELRDFTGKTIDLQRREEITAGFYHFELPLASTTRPYHLQLRADGQHLKAYKITSSKDENTDSRGR